MSTPYQEGMSAFEREELTGSTEYNPYDQDSSDWYDWNRGYNQAGINALNPKQ